MNHKDYSRITIAHNNITHQQSSMDLEDKKPMGFSGVLRKEMMIEAIFVLPIYVLISWLCVTLYRFHYIIKIMSDIENLVSELMSDDQPIDKREFLLEKVKNGEPISNSKTPWTVERLEKASDKVVDKLFDKYQNPPPVKINKKEALELGKPICPVVIEMYAEGLKTLVDQMPYIKGRYIINCEKLKRNISTNKLFCDNLAIKVGSKMIEQMGENSATRVGVSLAAMTWDALEKREEKVEVGDSSENKKDE